MGAGEPMPRTTRLGRFLRGRRFDHNPLRRAADRIESAVLTVLVIAFLAGGPFAALATGARVHDMAHRAQLAQEASRRHVLAVVLTVAAPDVDSGFGWQARARWRAPDGREVTGQVPVPSSVAVGAILDVWTDRTGTLSAAPITDAQVAGQTVLGEVLGVMAAAAVLALAAAQARRSLDKRRMAAWDAAWHAAGPHWTTRA